ncbi:YoaK family protein [Rariglobus hedericola]|uniref:YoaK family protein n=1 Tax=Rariglobus hedericola TaxID=2597822 RepID=UPI00193AA1BA|nr:YoaK family protein [Rariglobus hedericola]
MLSKPIPPWILAGGFVLTCAAGSINAVGFLGMHHQAISHMSGTVTVLSNELATGQFSLAWYAVMVVLAFFTGSVLSAVIIRQSALKLGRRYGVALMLESVLLIVASRLLAHGDYMGECLAAMACGLQNAMATHYSGAIIRTTHVTGIITDLGIAVGLKFTGEPIEKRRTGLLLVLLAGFFTGGILGSWGYTLLGFDTLLFPAALTGVAGGGYFAYKYFARRGMAES